jgi:hypothetical protein
LDHEHQGECRRREQLVNPALATVLSAEARFCLLHVLARLLS